MLSNTSDTLFCVSGSKTPCAGGVEGAPFRKNSTGSPISASSVGITTKLMKSPPSNIAARAD